MAIRNDLSLYSFQEESGRRGLRIAELESDLAMERAESAELRNKLLAMDAELAALSAKLTATEAERDELYETVASLGNQIEALELSAAATLSESWEPVGEDFPDEGEIRDDYGNWWVMHEGMIVAGDAEGQEWSVDLTKGYAVCKRGATDAT